LLAGVCKLTGTKININKIIYQLYFGKEDATSILLTSPETRKFLSKKWLGMVEDKSYTKIIMFNKESEY
jgi:hypothetical protein